MLNTNSVNTVNESRFSQRFTRPRYDSYCFSNIPPTIQFLLTGQGQSALPLDVFSGLPTRYDAVVLFFIDAFGWRFFERYVERFPFLKTLSTQGVASKLTAQFPSTTAAHVTCIHTGLDVGQSGVYEWNYYEPLVDEIISPLPFSYAGERNARDTVRNALIPPSSFFPQQTFYHTLQTRDVASHIFQHQAYTHSSYSEVVFQGAHVHPYQSIEEALYLLALLLTTPPSTRSAPTPTYYFLYFDQIDVACHHFGPFSRQFERTVEAFLQALELIFFRTVRGKAGKTLFMMTADHGQVEVDPQSTIYLNQQMPEIERLLKTNRRGSLLVPAGSARDMFLHVKEECIAEAIAMLEQHLAGRAEVYAVSALLKQHFFGLQQPSQVLLERLGNVVILPYKHQSVWWYEERKFNMHFLGHHGGLTPEEMEIPLLALPL